MIQGSCWHLLIFLYLPFFRRRKKSKKPFFLSKSWDIQTLYKGKTFLYTLSMDWNYFYFNVQLKLGLDIFFKLVTYTKPYLIYEQDKSKSTKSVKLKFTMLVLYSEWCFVGTECLITKCLWFWVLWL